MSDASSRSIGTVLGLNKSKPPKAPGPMPQLMTEEQQHKEAIIYALSATDKLREERDLALNRVQQLASELAAVRTDSARELMAQKTEYDGNIAIARADNTALRRQLGETGEKLEKFERWCYQIQTKCEDLQKYFSDQLAVLEDAKTHVALGIATATNNAATTINNAMTALHDSAQHATEGLGKQITHVVTDSRAFLTDLKQKAIDTPYRPEPKPAAPPQRPRESVEQLSAKAEAELSNWIAMRNTVKSEEDDHENHPD
jgi:hypothetical protein